MVKLSSTLKRKKGCEDTAGEFSDYKTANMTYYGLVLAIIFMSVYVIFAISDGLYNQTTDVLKSSVFVFNVVALILLIMVLFMERFSGKRVSYVRIVLVLGVVGICIASSVELHKLLEATGTDREDTTQFVISVIGLFFAFMSSFAILAGNVMSLVPK